MFGARGRRRSRPGALVPLAAALAVGAALLPAPAAPRTPSGLAIEITRVPLDAEDPTRERVGSLVFRGGLWLRSADPRFGGLSDLRVSADGAALWAVSDCGYGFSARLSYDSGGRLAGLADARVADLVDGAGRALAADRRDAESLVVNGPSLEVGFEGANRILAYALAPPFAGPARPVPAPAGLSRCAPNGGIEAMALLGPRRRLLICEARRLPSKDVPAWTGDDGRWSERPYALSFAGGWAGEPFRPTGAARLADGDVLVLERRFPPIGARIVRIAGGPVAADEGALSRSEIARFESPLTLDNFEGIETRQVGGRTLVYLLSDDNDCVKGSSLSLGIGRQRTLLLMFALET